MRFSLPVAAAAALVAAPAFADDPMALPYEIFEFAVPHVDLDTCPDAMADLPAFCRATLANDEVHVFAFGEDGDSPLLAVRSFPADRLPDILSE